MEKRLLKKLTLNALNALLERYDNDGCNDWEDDESLLNNLTKKEKLQVYDRCSKLARGVPFNTDIITLVIKKLKA